MEKEGVKMRFSLAKERKDADLIQTKLSAAYTAFSSFYAAMSYDSLVYTIIEKRLDFTWIH